MEINMKAAAKINLSLDITGKRADGYHELRSVMQSVGLYEIVRISVNDSSEITLTCDKPDIPCDDRNIAVKCAKAFFEAAKIQPIGISIDIQKNIPVQAGLAGGSADGAAVLRGLNILLGDLLSEEKQLLVGASVGADIPFCMTGGTILAEGIGERLTRLKDIPDCHFVIVKPSVGISTAEAYSAVDKSKKCISPSTDAMIAGLHDIRIIGKNLQNDFEQALNIAEIRLLTDMLKRCDGCLGACMSGSGSAVFAVFANESEAKACAEQMKKIYPFAEVAAPTTKGVFIGD